LRGERAEVRGAAAKSVAMKRTIGFVLAWLLLSLTGTAAAAQISVTNAWSRPAIDTGVVYATVRNDAAKADRLVGAKSPIAQHVEVHESMSSSGPMGDMASMHRVRFVAVPAHGRLVLGPGGYHIMLIGLKKPLKAGMRFPIELDFAHAGPVTARVAVHTMD